MNHTAGPIEQHIGIGHPGDDGIHRRGLHRIGAKRRLARGSCLVKLPWHQRRTGDADEGSDRAGPLQTAEHDKCGQHESGDKQNKRRAAQPVRP